MNEYMEILAKQFYIVKVLKTSTVLCKSGIYLLGIGVYLKEETCRALS